MSSWIRLDTSYHDHRKTRKLRRKIGPCADLIMPRLWCHAAEKQPDGDFSDYSYEEIRKIADYTGDAEKLVLHLQAVGYIDEDMKLHEWMEHNGHAIAIAKQKASRAAKARWSKFYASPSTNSTIVNDTNGTYVTVRNVTSTPSSNASSRKQKADPSRKHEGWNP